MYGAGVADEWAPRATVQPSADWWRPTRSLANWLTWLFAVQAVAQLANVFAVDNAEIYVRWHRAFDALLDGRNDAAQRILDRNQAEGSPWGSVLTFVAVRGARAPHHLDVAQRSQRAAPSVGPARA